MALKRPQPTLRFDREAWLDAAMEALSREGHAGLRVERLSNALGVTRGSFYHHFKNREEFVHAILDYWSTTFTVQVTAELASTDHPASDRLLLLMQMIERERLDRYDIAFRSWAAQDPAVAEKVHRVDELRFDYVRSLFAELGFSSPELEDRTHIFLAFVSAQRTVFVPNGSKVDDETITRRHAFFTRPIPDGQLKRHSG